MKLNANTYFSYEANMQYASVSQIKDFLKCEQCAYMKLKGQYEEEPSKAMAISSLIDAVMSDEEFEFLSKEKENPNSFIYLKSGKLSADAQTAYEVIEQAKNDPMFMKYLGGEHQVIMTGVIADVPIKIKMDSYFKDKVIVDLKAVRDMNLIWDEKDRTKKNFVDMYDYVLQRCDLSRGCLSEYW